MLKQYVFLNDKRSQQYCSLLQLKLTCTCVDVDLYDMMKKRDKIDIVNLYVTVSVILVSNAHNNY